MYVYFQPPESDQMAENLLMSQILRLLATLIKYGYYDDPVDVHSPLQQIFKILEYSPPSKRKSKSTKTIELLLSMYVGTQSH